MSSGLHALCYLVAGFILAVACLCALFSRIASAQGGAVGCFVVLGLFCFLLLVLLLLAGLA
jgi:hypothetical protein